MKPLTTEEIALREQAHLEAEALRFMTLDSETGLTGSSHLDYKTNALFSTDDAISFAVGGLMAIVEE